MVLYGVGNIHEQTTHGERTGGLFNYATVKMFHSLNIFHMM